jgi:alpha-galactosidase
MSKKINIGYIGGGSMGWAWSVMKDLVLEPELYGEVRLYDIDHEAAKANEIIGNRLNSHPHAVSRWEYKYTATLEEGLTGADFVIISILPGTFDEMESDVHTPEAYGIFQSVGDTTGPAGVIRSMRTVPMLTEMAEAIKRYCPNAWVINYTNPMAVCVAALYHAFPKIKAFGCCHEVFHTESLLKMILKEELDIETEKKDIHMNIIGVNHFTWVNHANYKDIDLMPLFAEFAKKHAKNGYSWWDGDHDPTNMFRNLNKVCFDLFLRYRAIPSAGDRHIAEFLPGYLHSRESCDAWGFGLTPVAIRKVWREQALEKRSRILNGEEPFNPSRSGEEGTKLIKALLGMENLLTNANMPNIGQMQDLPLGAIVEGNAVFGRDSVKPVWAGRLPDAAHLLVEKQARQQMNLMRACVNGDMDLAFEVFLEDNLVQLQLNDAKKLFKKMADNTQAYLIGFKHHIH